MSALHPMACKCLLLHSRGFPPFVEIAVQPNPNVMWLSEEVLRFGKLAINKAIPRYFRT